MSTLWLTRGLPASGKTTWAKSWVAELPTQRARVNRDDLREMIFDVPDYSWSQEQAVTEASRAMVKALLAMGKDVVADDMNLRPKYVREWARFAAANGAPVKIQEFEISIEESIDRDRDRGLQDGRRVGSDVIRGMAKYLKNGELQPIPPSIVVAKLEEQKYEPLIGSTPAIMVDIDGTLALFNGRSPYDLARCGEDLPNGAVVEAVRAAYHDGLEVIYCSGREDSAAEDTEDWIDLHVKVPGDLLMRETGDRRKDSIVKRELFDEHIRPFYDVRYVLDDRQQVVDMWRELGLTVFQVAPGDF